MAEKDASLRVVLSVTSLASGYLEEHQWLLHLLTPHPGTMLEVVCRANAKSQRKGDKEESAQAASACGAWHPGPLDVTKPFPVAPAANSPHNCLSHLK